MDLNLKLKLEFEAPTEITPKSGSEVKTTARRVKV